MRFSKMGEFLLLLRTKQTCIESLLRKYFIIFIALVPLPEIKKTLVRESSDWIQRCKIEDSDDLGRALYHIASFEKIKQVTIPLDAFHLLMVYVDNIPLKKTKTKSYGRYVEMGKIMSIVDFVNTFQE